MSQDAEREWTQDELRNYLLTNGLVKEDFREGEKIPQGVKYINFAPLTERDIARAKELIAEHPEWTAPRWLPTREL